MKFPSLIKTPRNKKFNFEPRHYDPVKEDLEQRISKTKNNIKENVSYKLFKRKEENSFLKPKNLQLFLMLLFSIISIGWLFYGNIIFILFLIIPLIYFFNSNKRSKKFNEKSNS